MKKGFFLSALFVLLLSGFLVWAQKTSVLAQENQSDRTPLTDEQRSRLVPISAVRGGEPSGNVSCFDYYRFGSVQVDLESNLTQTVPGTEIAFFGKIKNENDYPLVNGTVYVKVFRKDDTTYTQGNGNPVVDQFALSEKFTLPAKGEHDAAFTWHVPVNAPAGEYYVATFFATEDRYNLLGLSFTDDVVGNMTHFTVTNPDGAPVAGFSKNETTLNGKRNVYAAFPLHFNSTETVEVKVKLVNPDPNPKVMQVVWMEYAWDALRPENERHRKYELVEVGGNETKELAYTVTPTNDAVSYLVAEARDGEAKTFLNVRFVRDGAPETRINFPSILKYPLKAGEENALFACAHSTNEEKVAGNTLTLTLRDEAGNTIHQYQYNGDIAGAMGGWKDSFTPDTYLANFTLTATLEREGVVREEVHIKYDCNEIDPNLCTEPKEDTVSKMSGKNIAILVIGGLTLLALLMVLVSKLRNRNTRTLSIFLLGFLLAGGLFVGGAEVGEAKSAVRSLTIGEQLYYYWDWGGTGGTVNGWQPGLAAGASVNVTYNATLKNADTGAIINEGATLPAGTKVTFDAPYSNADISWNGTGLSSDSPNGRWSAGAAPPAPACNAADLVTTGAITGGQCDEWTPQIADVYIPLAVNRGAVTSTATGLTSVGTNVWQVTSAGAKTLNVNFAATYGRFYYRYYACWTCIYNQVAMARANSTAPYDIPIAATTISFSFNGANPPNQPPAAPTLTCPATATVNVAANYSFRGTDPDGNPVKYGIDWDNNGSVDQWAPASGTVASNTSQTVSRAWTPAGVKTLKALTQDSNGANSGWSATCTTNVTSPVNGVCGAAHNFPATTRPTTGLCNAGTASAVAGTGPWTWTCAGTGGGTTASCSAPLQNPLPVVDLRINGSNGPLTVPAGTNLNLTWANVANATSCTGSGTGWTGSKARTGGNENVTANAASLYTLSCTGPGGTATDSVSVTLSNTLKVCENSCNSGVMPPASFTMSLSSTKNLVACWNTSASCDTASGNVTGSATWGEGGSSPVSLSGTNPKVLTATSSGTENISATYSANTVNKSVTVTCVPTVDCSNAPGRENYCQDQNFDVDNGCGATISCTGSKTCNYNWRETAP